MVLSSPRTSSCEDLSLELPDVSISEESYIETHKLNPLFCFVFMLKVVVEFFVTFIILHWCLCLVFPS